MVHNSPLGHHTPQGKNERPSFESAIVGSKNSRKWPIRSLRGPILNHPNRAGYCEKNHFFSEVLY